MGNENKILKTRAKIFEAILLAIIVLFVASCQDDSKTKAGVEEQETPIFFEDLELKTADLVKAALRAKANKGDMKAQKLLGRLLIGDEKFQWYLKAAEQGDRLAQMEVAKAYNYGLYGVAKDETQAFKWYEKAALQGDIKAQKELAHAYTFGRFGVEKNEAEAVRWHEKAASLGDIEAQKELARIYDYGWFGIAGDKAKAYKWYKKAALQGDTDSQSAVDKVDSFQELIAELKKKGELDIREELREKRGREIERFKQNEKKALQGDAYAQESLGFAYYWGDGVTRDMTKAFEWFMKAALQGEVSSQRRVAKAYEAGEGVAKDKTKAVEWYEKAALQGDLWAQQKVVDASEAGIIQSNEKILEWKKNIKEREDQRIKKFLSSLKGGFVSDSDINSALSNLPVTLQQARAVPYFKDGASIGLRLFAIRGGSIYEKLGLINGDILLKLNGVSLSDTSQLTDIISKIEENKESTLDVERERTRFSVHYTRSDNGFKFNVQEQGEHIKLPSPSPSQEASPSLPKEDFASDADRED